MERKVKYDYAFKLECVKLVLDKNNSSVASRIIADTFETGLIKLSDPEITSRKYATYIPYYA